MASPSPEAEPPEQSDSSAEEAAAPADASSLWLVLARDVAIVAAALSLFAAADAWHTLTGATLSAGLALIDGVLVGVLLGGLIHEWGHFTGARLYGSRAPLRPATGFLPLFDFDYPGNSRQQFLGMSVGGNLAHWLVVFVLLLGLPLSSIGQVALVSGAFGFAVFASSVEFPVIRHAYRGLSGIEALAKLPKDFVRRNGSYGLIAAVLALFVL
ncbi:MAG: hypothetical protein HRU00_00025 [Myxococcales bacterium]|nr:hypothetical protein [Myxococcales bacterium]